MEPLAVEEIAKRFAAALRRKWIITVFNVGGILETLASKMNPRACRGDCKGLRRV